MCKETAESCKAHRDYCQKIKVWQGFLGSGQDEKIAKEPCNAAKIRLVLGRDKREHKCACYEKLLLGRWGSLPTPTSCIQQTCRMVRTRSPQAGSCLRRPLLALQITQGFFVREHRGAYSPVASVRDKHLISNGDCIQQLCRAEQTTCRANFAPWFPSRRRASMPGQVSLLP